MIKKILLICLFSTTIMTTAFATVWTVQNTNDAGPESLRAMIDSAGNVDTIRFNPSLINSGSNTIMLDSVIEFSKGLTLIGVYNSMDTLYISGATTDGAFHVTLDPIIYYERYFTLDSMAFVNLSTDWNGSALFVEDSYDVYIRNSFFANNVSQQNGGAVSVDVSSYPGRLHIDNCVFNNNQSLNSTGGAVNFSTINESTVNVNNSTFNGNTSKLSGGAIRVYGVNYHANVNAVNSTFINNSSSEGSGGALYANSLHSSSNYVITSCTFAYNVCDDNGGAMGNNGNNNVSATINESTLYNNSANNGGTIYCFSSSNSMTVHSHITINNSTIYGNTASSNGGAFYADSYGWSGPTNITTINSSIVANNGNNELFVNGDPIISDGFNFFSSNHPGAEVTDEVAATVGTLNLGPLQYNGGVTKTLMPDPTSIVIDGGDPAVTIAAQNIPVIGTRDAGAAEYCSATSSNISRTNCESYTVPSGDETYFVSGIFMDTIANSAGCDSVLTISVTIETITSNTVTSNGATLTTNATGVSYQWVDCNNGYAPITGETGSSYTALVDGDYAVIVSNGSCTDTSVCESAIVGLSLNENSIDANIEIYPNPSDGNNIFIKYTEKIISIDIYDQTGRWVKSLNTNNQNHNLSNLSNGRYLCKIVTNNGVAVKQIVIVK